MTPETQTVEWKRAWRDEYLAWICGFANAQGGVLEIGKDDDGEVVGVRNVLSLLEDIPAKVRALLGIVVEVNLKAEAGREYIEIVVAPHANPISYRGKFHYRSGSTKQVLEGAALTRFLLERHGRTWDDVALPGVRLSELDGRALEAFRRLGAKSKRLPPDVLDESDDEVIERLQLREGALLKRASALLFHPAPHRLVMGAYVKIGDFQGGDLRFQDVIEGDLFTQVDRTLDLLYTKYTRGLISYRDDIYRVETFPVPLPAMREAVINALIHRDYAEPASTQIRVNDEDIEIRNAALLPPDWAAVETGMLSRPHNPLIAQTFFRAGMIEAWGRGIRQITEHCRGSRQSGAELDAGARRRPLPALPLLQGLPGCRFRQPGRCRRGQYAKGDPGYLDYLDYPDYPGYPGYPGSHTDYGKRAHPGLAESRARSDSAPSRQARGPDAGRRQVPHEEAEGSRHRPPRRHGEGGSMGSARMSPSRGSAP